MDNADWANKSYWKTWIVERDVYGKYTKEEKLKILKEAKRQGVKVTLKKYDLYAAIYYYWNMKYDAMGSEGIDHGMTKDGLRRIKQLEKEVAMLKEIVAEKELDGKLNHLWWVIS